MDLWFSISIVIYCVRVCVFYVSCVVKCSRICVCRCVSVELDLVMLLINVRGVLLFCFCIRFGLKGTRIRDRGSLHALERAANLIIVEIELVVQFIELHALEVHLVAKQT